MSLRDGANFDLFVLFVYAFFFLCKYLIMRCLLSSQGCGPQCCELCSKKPQLADFLYKLQVVVRRETASGFYPWGNALFQGCFFMFLFLIPFTIRQQSISYPHIFFTDPDDVCVVVWKKWAAFPFGGNAAVVCFKSRFWGLSVGWCACYFATFTAVPLERRKM